MVWLSSTTRVLRTHTRCAVIVYAVSIQHQVHTSVWVREQLQSAKHTYNEPGRDVTWTALVISNDLNCVVSD